MKDFKSLRDTFLWYDGDQREELSKENLRVALIGFILVLAYAVLSLMFMIFETDRRVLNGVDTRTLCHTMIRSTLPGILVSIYLVVKSNVLEEKITKERLILCRNLILIYCIIMYYSLISIYMYESDLKTEPIMIFGIVIGVFAFFSYESPYILSLINTVTILITFNYIRENLGRPIAIMSFIYVSAFTFSNFVKARAYRRIFQKESYLKKLNKETSDKYDSQIKLNSEIQRNTIRKLADLIECRDNDTGEHTKRVSDLVRMIAYSLRDNLKYQDILTDTYISSISYSAMLHDVGKIKISDNILKAPRKLTSNEFEIIKLHTIYGKDIIDSILLDSEGDDYINKTYAEEIAMFHHEKWDGSGYPESLKGEEIPLHARIMAVADVFDAMVSKRCYKDSMDYDDAFGIIEEGSGSHFDPDIVEAFLNIKEDVIEMYEKNRKYTEDGDYYE